MVKRDVQLYYYIVFYKKRKNQKINQYFKQQDTQPKTISKNLIAIKKDTMQPKKP